MNDPSNKKKDIKKIFLGFVLIFLGVFSLALALYWPEFQKQFSRGSRGSWGKETPTARPVPAVAAKPVPKPAYEAREINRKEGYLWVDPGGQYVVTLGQVQGVLAGRKLNVYDGSDLLGQVVVERSLETVSYVRPETSVKIVADNFYRVVIE